MKIRNGFVSNSSSSSFIIVGKQIELPTSEEVEADESKFEYYEDTALPKGMVSKDGEFMMLTPYQTDGYTIIGFGKYGPEYDWSGVDFNKIEEWRVKANALFGDIESKIWFGIENPDH